MAERSAPKVYSIAAHRGFADALVAGLVPRYAEEPFGLAKLTLLLPSARAARTMSEAFIRYAGAEGLDGLLMPRMVMVGDLDLDESLGNLLDPLGASDIPPAVEPTRRWFELAQILKQSRDALGEGELPATALFNQARELGRTMDRLLVEQVRPDDLFKDDVVGIQPELAKHWQDNTRLFALVFKLWDAWLSERGLIDAAERRNRLFERAERRWRDDPPETPIVAAGVTSAAPALARMLRVVADLPQGAVVLPDLDLALPPEAWEELGRAGAPIDGEPGVFGKGDAVTHPQYHLKLLLNRMGVNRAEVQAWHRRGMAASEPERSHAVSSLFLPPKASRAWVDLESSKRRISGLQLIETSTIEEEAQAIAVLVRGVLEEPEKRVALVTPDRGLARRVSQQLERWRIQADDTAGRPLDVTPAGRLLLLLAQIAGEGTTPIPLIAALSHPLVKAGEQRRDWLRSVRALERRLRGPRPAPGLSPIGIAAKIAGQNEWWAQVEPILAAITAHTVDEHMSLVEALDMLVAAGEALAGERLWSNEDGRALASFVEDLRLHASDTDVKIRPAELHAMLREAMSEIAVRPPYGGHPRVAIYGLLESRMTRADLVICAGLNEGTWPGIPSPDPLLAPAMLRELGVPASDFRIGLAAHDLAGAMGAPEVVLTRALRDADGPTIPSRFLSRVGALLGEEELDACRNNQAGQWAAALDREVERAPDYPRPRPDPDEDLRRVPIRVTSLDRLLGDPYQFYAQSILALRVLDPLDGDVTQDPAWKGTRAHRMIEEWHRRTEAEPELSIADVAREVLERENAHPMLRGLWLPRLLEGLNWIERTVRDQCGRTVVGVELDGAMEVDGVKIYGRADRIDRRSDGALVIIDYKTGSPPSAKQAEKGFALQLGLLGLIARDGSFNDKSGAMISGDASRFEYWSLAKKGGDFGYFDEPYVSSENNKRSGLELSEFLPEHEKFLNQAISQFIKGRKPFTAKLNPDYPGYADYDQLMRLEEWQIRLADSDESKEG